MSFEAPRYSEFWRYANKNLFSALEAARTACRTAPENEKAWISLAEICVVTTEPKEGLAAVEKALPMVKTAKERERLEALKKQIREALEKKQT